MCQTFFVLNCFWRRLTGKTDISLSIFEILSRALPSSQLVSKWNHVIRRRFFKVALVFVSYDDLDCDKSVFWMNVDFVAMFEQVEFKSNSRMIFTILFLYWQFGSSSDRRSVTFCSCR